MYLFIDFSKFTFLMHSLPVLLFVCFVLLTHIRRSTGNSKPVTTSSAGGAKGCSDHKFRAPPTYTAQLLTLHQHRANNQYRTADQIQPTLRVSSSTQATLEQSPIQVLRYNIFMPDVFSPCNICYTNNRNVIFEKVTHITFFDPAISLSL